MKTKKAFTYVELIIAMAIMGILMYLILDLFNISLITQKESSKQFEIQADVTYAGNTFTEVVRDATALFLLSENKFNPANATEANIHGNISQLNMTKGWNYIALNDTKDKIYNFVWDEAKKTHIPFLLTLPDKGHEGNKVEYDIDFVYKKTQIENKINQLQAVPTLSSSQIAELKALEKELEASRTSLDFSIEGKVINNNYGIGSNDQKLNEYKIDSTVLAQNTRQVIDITNNRKPTAIAYRTTDFITQDKVYQKPAIALVLDFSGSMQYNLNGNWPSSGQQNRESLLRKEFANVLKNLMKNGDFDLFIIPFSSFAFHDDHHVTTTSFDDLKRMQPFEIKRNEPTNINYVNATQYLSNFTAGGGTNYGDGVRHGLKYLRSGQTEQVDPNRTYKTYQNTYLFVLSDGEPTVISYKDGNKHLGDNPDSYKSTWADLLTYNQCTAFVGEIIGDSVTNYPSFKPNLTYLVGFSNVPADNARLDTIEGYFESKMKMEKETVKVIKATTQEELKKAFDGFVSDINQDLWYFDGP